MSGIPQMDPGAFFRAHREELAAAMTRVMDSGRYIVGAEVAAFEQDFAQHFGFPHAVAVASGTDALALALQALGIGPGEKVATVSHTAVATTVAILMTGATPVFFDIDPVTYTFEPAALARRLESDPDIKAIVPVHLYGQPADLRSLGEITRRFGVRMIEDCAQSHGATFGDRYTGSFGDAAAFSFYPTKNLGAMGDGGMVVVRDAECAQRLRALREYGWRQRYISEERGMNSRLDEVQAAILRARLPYLTENNLRRMAIAAAYDSGLGNMGLVLPARRREATHVYHQYVVRHPERDSFRARLLRAGVGTNIHYPQPVHRQPAYESRFAQGDPAGLPETEKAAREVLSLPMYPEMTDAAVATVIDAVRQVL